jgi:DNA-binding NarL/FixJ family response regulator
VTLHVLVVTDHPLAGAALASCLSEDRHVISGFADGRRPCAVHVRDAAPEVVLVDEMEATALALARIRELRTAAPEAKIVLLTSNMDPVALRDAAAAGTDAAIRKSLAPESLSTLLRDVVAGNVFHAFLRPPAPALERAKPAGLTRRELQILRLVAAGRSNGQVGAQLWVTEQTVKFHLSNVYRKLGVANRTQASRHAHLHGLLDPETGPVPARESEAA